MKRAGQQIAGGLRTLAAPTLDDDLKHLVSPSRSQSTMKRITDFNIVVFSQGIYLRRNLGALQPSA
jgi:hypothetical protein